MLAAARNRLGDFSFYGMGGCAVDYPAAVGWYTRASNAGNAQVGRCVGWDGKGWEGKGWDGMG